MTAQIPNPNSPRSTSADAPATLVRPALLHALTYLLFGAITIFYQQPSLAGLSLLTGIFLLLLGANNYLLGTRLKTIHEATGQGLGSIGLLVAAAGVLLLFAGRSEFWFTLIVAVALGAASILKALLGLRAKGLLELAKDWQFEGIIMTLAALSTLLAGGIGTKAIMGLLGGGALIVGVFLLVGAFSLKYDAKKS